jgi:hypothetical protein
MGTGGNGLAWTCVLWVAMEETAGIPAQADMGGR